MSEDSIFLLHAVLTGMFITIVYDGLIILRRVIAHKAWVESFEDLVFWIFCAIYVFMWLYREGDGTLRWFAVAGALTGMLLYKKTISHFFVKTAVWLLGWLLKILGKVFGVLFAPLRMMKRGADRVHSNIRNRRRKMLANLKIRLKSYGKALKIKLSKQ